MVGPSEESFGRGLGLGFVVLALCAASIAIFLVPQLKKLRKTNLLMAELEEIRKRFQEARDKYQFLEANNIAREAIGLIAVKLDDIHRGVSGYLQQFWNFLSERSLDSFLKDTKKVLEDSDDSTWDLFARNFVEFWKERWKSAGYPDGTKLRNIYNMLVFLCQPGSKYYDRIQNLLRRLSQAIDDGTTPPEKLLRLYAKMLEENRESSVDTATIEGKLNAVLNLSGLSDIEAEGKDWQAIYDTFKKYLNSHNFVEAGKVAIPNLSGKVLGGVVYVLHRIHGFPNDRDPNIEREEIKAMIAHLHEPERTILNRITDEW